MRTVVVSDVHLGVRRSSDLVRRPALRRRLLEGLAGADRVVLLGDLLELRECTLAEAVRVAEPFFAELGEALPAAEVVVVPGNHDHALAAPVVDAAGGAGGLQRLEHRMAVGGADPLGPLAARLGGARLELAYPGLWLSDAIYATHGHYMDVHSSVPTFECVAVAGSARAAGGPPGPGSRPSDYERILAPVYRAAVRAGRAAGATGLGSGAALSAGLWSRLAGDATRPGRPTPAGEEREARRGGGIGPELAALSAQALSGALAPAVAWANRAGLGPFDADFSGAALRRSGLRSIAEAVRRLEVDAAHVIFGHTHRAGPLPRDDAAEWAPAGLPQLHNPGSWVYEPVFVSGAPGKSPYWPGRVIVVENDEPALLPLLDDVAHDQLAGR